MVRAETYASKWGLPRKAASAAPSCMVNASFHFYCPKELLVGISQSNQRGDEMNHCHCSGVQQCSSPTFSGAHLPSLPTYFFQLHLSLLILPWRLAWNPSPAVFWWWANSSWGFVGPQCTKLLPTSNGVEPSALHPSTSPETAPPPPSATAVVVLSLWKQNSQGTGSKHRSCFCAVLVLSPLKTSPLFKVIPAIEILLNLN